MSVSQPNDVLHMLYNKVVQYCIVCNIPHIRERVVHYQSGVLFLNIPYFSIDYRNSILRIQSLNRY